MAPLILSTFGTIAVMAWVIFAERGHVFLLGAILALLGIHAVFISLASL